ncbi:JAB domain-containing protein [Brevundimonas sp. FT23042]|uniref:JAB domain-containing protein n=1 Tax=Brevundimonas sp. FT23042 TaxID=3393749 RepID=UPI003B588138
MTMTFPALAAGEPRTVRQSGQEAEAALLARLLGAAFGEAGADRFARVLIDHFGGVGASVVAPKAEVSRALGAGGEICADHLADLHALVLTVVRRKALSRPLLGSRTALRRYLSTALSNETREQFRVLYLDSRNGLIREEIAGEGTRDHAPVYPREIIRRALELSASALILVHNHPSGDPTPSAQDLNTTDQIMEGAAVFGIAVHDHLVVGRKRVFSFHDAGLLAAAPGARPSRDRAAPARTRRTAGKTLSADTPSPSASVHSD